jgi:hypothetical protein
MAELGDSKIKVVVLDKLAVYMLDGQLVAILTPTHATSVPTVFRKGTICLPFVIVLSILGLKASPEKKVRIFGCPANCGWKR